MAQQPGATPLPGAAGLAYGLVVPPPRRRPRLASESRTRCFERAVSLCCCAIHVWISCKAPYTTRLHVTLAAGWVQLAALAFFAGASHAAWRRWRVWAIGAMRLSLHLRLQLAGVEVRLPLGRRRPEAPKRCCIAGR